MIGQWWLWSHGERDSDDLLMVCPNCVTRMVHDDMEQWLAEHPDAGT